MVDSVDQKRSSKFKKIFRPPYDNNNNPLAMNKQLHISPPILQHSTSIYSLVSPTRTSFNRFYSRNNDIPYELYKPSSPPPPIPLTIPDSISNSLSPMPRKHQNNKKKTVNKSPEAGLPPTKVCRTMGNIDDDTSSTFLSHFVDSRITHCTDPEDPSSTSSEEEFKDCKRKLRRHSCASNISFQPNDKDKSLKTERVQSTRLTDSYHHMKNKSITSSISSAAISISPSTSRSTPLHKVKTYNVAKKKRSISDDDVEKQRKIKELEELIISRRERTLKLSLTPKVLS
ncbi:hypothetical protein BDB01DRAFT_849425 [Pilobolus umbonatus]|nr:hypothetical protein BDB01DRAFT_849425 [Pilobolus umbonatus]